MNVLAVPSARRRIASVATVLVMATAGVFGAAGTAFAASPEVEVLPATLASTGWSYSNTTGTGTFDFVDAAGAPLGTGALLMSTPDNADNVLLGTVLGAGVPLATADFSYASKRLSGPVHAAPGLVFTIDLNDLVVTDELYAWFEPVYNGGTDYDNWNTWSVTSASQFWFNGAHNGNFFSGAFTATLDQVLVTYPDAEITELYLNMGSGNPGWSALVDAVDDMTSTFNFERVTAPAAVDPSPAAAPELASTGVAPELLLGSGLVLVLVGGALFAAVRTRRVKASIR